MNGLIESHLFSRVELKLKRIESRENKNSIIVKMSRKLFLYDGSSPSASPLLHVSQQVAFFIHNFYAFFFFLRNVVVACFTANVSAR